MAIHSRIRTAVIGLLVSFTGVTVADAHPHIWVTTKSEIVYAADGTVKAVRQAWTFDDMFSAFATQGLDTNKDGKLSREELAELAKVNVTSLKEFDYFSEGKSGGKKIVFDEPVDYWLDADDKQILTLHFTLPVKSPAPRGNFTIDIFDPTYFIAFALADELPVTLAGAPAGCSAEVRRPDPAATATTNLSESFFNSLNAGSDYGAQFANRISVRCK
jgi:ABC-type uncharacterized transport system substrate-binding protein